VKRRVAVHVCVVYDTLVLVSAFSKLA
jgi:hypothetical protein